ncbi:hypothetical protein 101118UKE1_005 [Escherichia phage vB_EcoP-101118UKE1]|uniref:Uncharacterized protein n=1 Tax=Escherichia phage vB_EcoP-101118UKE1 TaxID=2865798 RepID=A0ABX9AHQ4_9CAUD|nr:hypothetical protein 101118UKE1_005 [Escherichia phage vB_EcoP-101118UKE1]
MLDSRSLLYVVAFMVNTHYGRRRYVDSEK